MPTYDYRTDSSTVEVWDDGGDGSAFAANVDGTGGVPANNGAIGRWTGRKGLGYGAASYNPTGSAATAIAAPTLLKNQFNGGTRSAVNFNGTTQGLAVALVGTSTPGAATLAGLADGTTGIGGSSGAIFVMFGPTTQWNVLFSKTAPGGSGRCSMLPGQATHTFLANGFLNGTTGDGRTHVQGFSWDGTRNVLKAFIDGCGVTGTPGPPTAADTTNPLMIGCEYNTGTLAVSLPYGGKIFKIMVMNQAPTPYMAKKMADDWFDEYGIARPDANARVIIVINGNSLRSADVTYVDQLNQALGIPNVATPTIPAYGITPNLAWGGKTGAQIAQYMAVDDWPLIDYLAQQHPGVRFVWTGWERTNDANVQAAASNSISNCLAMRAFFKARGYDGKVTDASMIDRFLTGVSPKRQINLRCSRKASLYCDALLDFDANPLTSPTSFDLGSCSSLYGGDRVHYNAGITSGKYLLAQARHILSQAPTPSGTCVGFQLVQLFAATPTTAGDRSVPGQQSVIYALVPVDASGQMAVWNSTVTLNTGNTSDAYVILDSTVTDNGSGQCTVDYTASPDFRPKAIQFFWGPSSTSRTVTIAGNGLTPTTRTITLTSTAATAFTIRGFGLSGAAWPINTPIPLSQILATASGSMAALGGTHNLTATVTAGTGTVAFASTGTNTVTLNASKGEEYFTATATAAGTFTVSIADSGGFATVTMTFTATNTAETPTITAPIVTSGHPNWDDSWPWTLNVPGATGATPFTLTDDHGGTLSPTSLTFDQPGSKVSRAAVIAAPIPNAGATHTLSSTNGASLTNPTTTIGVVSTVDYAFTCTGLTTLAPGQQTTFHVAPNATIYSDGVGCGDGSGAHGTFDQLPVFNQSSTAQDFHWTAPSTPGTYPITPTSVFGCPFSPTSINVTVQAPAASGGAALMMGM